MLAAVKQAFVAELLSWPECLQLLLATTCTSQVTAAVNALPQYFAQGLLILHDPGRTALLFLPNHAPRVLPLHQAKTWLTLRKTPVMLYTELEKHCAGHYVACLPSSALPCRQPSQDSSPCCPEGIPRATRVATHMTGGARSTPSQPRSAGNSPARSRSPVPLSQPLSAPTRLLDSPSTQGSLAARPAPGLPLQAPLRSTLFEEGLVVPGATGSVRYVSNSSTLPPAQPDSASTAGLHSPPAQDSTCFVLAVPDNAASPAMSVLTASTVPVVVASPATSRGLFSSSGPATCAAPRAVLEASAMPDIPPRPCLTGDPCYLMCVSPTHSQATLAPTTILDFPSTQCSLMLIARPPLAKRTSSSVFTEHSGWGRFCSALRDRQLAARLRFLRPTFCPSKLGSSFRLSALAHSTLRMACVGRASRRILASDGRARSIHCSRGSAKSSSSPFAVAHPACPLANIVHCKRCQEVAHAAAGCTAQQYFLWCAGVANSTAGANHSQRLYGAACGVTLP